MSEPVTVTAAAVAAAFREYLPGAMGAALALKFLGPALTVRQRITSFAAGLVCAAYLAPAVIEFFHIEGNRVHAGIQFLFGLFAMATARELFVEINNADLIGALKRRFLGGGQ
ncbi:holin [Oxalobacteraceae bacterium A2-2]